MPQDSNNQNLRWWVLLTVIIGTLLGRLDQTVVNLALPDIISDFGITVNTAGWIATAYILANAVFVPIWGKLGDTIGRKLVYILGFAIFIISSVLAALAWNFPSMIIFRVLQAIASSADYPTAMAILAATFPQPKERAQALGIWSSSFAAAAIIGILLGGPLIDGFGWRSVFWINLPVGIVGLIMAMTFIKESKSEVKTKHFDWWGSIALGVMLSALVLVLDKGMDWGWLSASSLICYFVVVVFLGWFIKVEQTSPEPIVDLKFFKIPAFVNTLLNNFVVFMGMMGALFLLPVFAQTFLGYNSTQTGYLFTPMALGMVAAAPLGGSLVGKVESRYVIFISTIVAALGMFLFVFLDPKSTMWGVTIPLFITALGMGFGMAQRTNIVASVVDDHEIGTASSVLALARNIAGAFGIAVFGTILTSQINTNVLEINRFSKLNLMTPETIQQYITLITLKAQINAYHTVFIVGAIIVFLGAWIVLWLKLDNERTDVKVHVE